MDRCGVVTTMGSFSNLAYVEVAPQPVTSFCPGATNSMITSGQTSMSNGPSKSNDIEDKGRHSLSGGKEIFDVNNITEEQVEQAQSTAKAQAANQPTSNESGHNTNSIVALSSHIKYYGGA